ncbi:MAG: relaxase/mobilization nuclease domain-containing protein [Nitrospirales bacterium]
MTPPLASHTDAIVDEWGSRLFNVSAPTAPRTQANGARRGAHIYAGTGGRLRTPAARAQFVRHKLRALVRRAPQVMVKLARAPKGMRGISNNLSYISRDGQLDLEDQDAQIITGKEAVRDLKQEWQQGGFPIPQHSTKRDAFHLILSMPTLTDPLAVQRAAREFAKREFSDHQYAMVLHTFETDPDPNPARHPHVHLTVKTAGLDGRRLNPRKPDLQRWREGFAEALREQGIEATTTSRLHRTTHERWKVRHLVDVATHATQVDRRTREAKVPRVQREVMQNYERVMRALARSDRGDDRQLAADLVRHFSGRSQVREREKEKPQER